MSERTPSQEASRGERELSPTGHALRRSGPRRQPGFCVYTAAVLLSVLGAASAADSLDVRVKGAWPYSIARTVLVDGGFAYVGIGGGLWVFDVNTPARPRRVGTLPLLGVACDIAKDGDLLLLAQKKEGMSIIDATDPTSPVFLGRVAGEIVSVALHESLALAGSYQELKVVDISNPWQPVQIGSFPLSVGGCDVSLRDTLALVADGDEGLRILGLSDPSNPHEVGHLARPAFRVGWEGSIAYVAQNDTLHTVDLSVPATPVHLGKCGYPWLAEVDVLENLCARDSLVYCACALFGLRIFNVADPSHPFVTGGESLPRGGFWADAVGVSGNCAFLAAENGGLQVADISNPQEPEWIGSYDTVPCWVENVCVTGDRVFLAARRGLWLLDVSDPTRPIERGVRFFRREVLAMVPLDSLLLVGVDDTLMVLNIRDPDNPRVVGACRTGHARAFCLKDTLLLAGIEGPTAEAGLVVINMSNPTNPWIVGRWPNEESDPYGVSVFRNYAILGDGYHRPGEPEGGFRLFDLSDPTNPVQLSRLACGLGSSVGSYVRNDTAFLCDEGGGLHVASVTDPENPVLLRTFTEFTPTTISVRGGLGAVANRYAGLSMADISEAHNVRELGYYRTPGVCRNVVPYGNLLHAANDYGGYLIFEYYGPSPGVGDSAAGAAPAGVGLAAIPSPTTNKVTVEFTVPIRCSVTVKLCDITGRTLGTLFAGAVWPGDSCLELSAEKLPAGTYFIVLQTGGTTQQARFTVP